MGTNKGPKSQPNVQFTPQYPLALQLRARDPRGYNSPGGIAKRDLGRWYGALDHELRNLKLEVAEMLLLVAAVEGWKTPDGAGLPEALPGIVRGGQQPGYGHVRGPLASRVEGWGHLLRWAVIDACERYVIEEKKGGTQADVMHRVGLNPYAED